MLHPQAQTGIGSQTDSCVAGPADWPISSQVGSLLPGWSRYVGSMTGAWTPEPFEADDGSVPFGRFVDDLSDFKRLTRRSTASSRSVGSIWSVPSGSRRLGRGFTSSGSVTKLMR